MGDSSGIITVLLGVGIPPDKAAFAAVRYSDAQRALNWCFEAGADWTPDQAQGPPPAPLLPAPAEGGSVENPIDMTLAGECQDDDELRKAIAASMADNSSADAGPSGTGWATPVGEQEPSRGMVTFGPSTQEATNQNALVPTSGWDTSPPPFTSTEDKEMNEAMFASFHDSLPGSDTIFTPRVAGPRAPGAPLALYNPDPGMAFATAMLQGLFALSSFQEILTFSYPDPIPAPPPGSDLIWIADCLPPKAWDDLQDLARMMRSESATEAVDKESILVGVEPGGLWPRARRNIAPGEPGMTWFEQIDELTGKALASAIIQEGMPPSSLLRDLLQTPQSPLRFFNFHTIQPLVPHAFKADHSKFSLHCTSLTNSLHKAISRELWPGGGEDDAKWAITGSGPHALSVFLTWPKSPPLGGRVSFELDDRIYVDRYLQRNFQQIFRLRASEGVLKAEEDELVARRAKIKTVKGKDVRTHLVNSISYFEALRKPSEDVALQERSGRTLVKLKSVLQEMDAELTRISERVQDVQAKRAGLFDGADLLKCPLELKAVMMHNALHSSGSVYSYVRHGDKWWCVSDGLSTEVTWDAVRADQTGLHLGAGAWCLLYERGPDWVEVEDEWEEGASGDALAPPFAEHAQSMDEDLDTGLATPPPEADALCESDDVDEMLGVESAGGEGGPRAERSPEEARLEDRAGLRTM